MEPYSNPNREHGKVRTPLWCHDCSRDFEVTFDYDLDGNHVVPCPNCGHEHCRVITAGVVTAERWDQRNGRAGNTFAYVASTSSTSVSFNTYMTQVMSGSTPTTSMYMRQLWTRSS